MPLRVHVDETPTFSPNQLFIGFVLYRSWAKLFLSLGTPESDLKRALIFLRGNAQNWDQIDMRFILKAFYFRVNVLLGELTAIPYALLKITIWVLDISEFQRVNLFKYVFSTYALAKLLKHSSVFFEFIMKKLQRHVFEEKYVIGKALRNVNPSVQGN